MTKPLMNIIKDWETIEDQPNLRIYGTAVLNQRQNDITTGNRMYTSKIVRIYRVGGKLIAETKNSLYILEN